MRGFTTNVIPALLFLTVSIAVGCDKKETAEQADKDEAKKSADAAEPKKSAGPSEAKDRSGTPAREEAVQSGPPKLEERSFTIERGNRQATVRAPIPAGWEEDRGGFKPPAEVEGMWQPRLSVAFGGYSCTGGCRDEDFERERDAVLEGAKERLARPNRNTGKPELDELRLEVTEVEKGELPGGGYVAYRVEVPQGVEGPYFQGIDATCSRFRTGEYGYIVSSVRIPKVAEEDLWPLLLDACKGADIDGSIEKK
jgi:hypothetical protein